MMIATVRRQPRRVRPVTARLVAAALTLCAAVVALTAAPAAHAQMPATMPAMAAPAATPTPENPAPDYTGATMTTPSGLSTPGYTAVDEKSSAKEMATGLNAVAGAQARDYYSINFVWVLVAGFLVMFMQAGFALVETGLCRAKNAAHVMTMNFLVYAVGMTAFFFTGFALMCGGANKSFVGGPGSINLARTDQVAKAFTFTGGDVTDATNQPVKNADGSVQKKEWVLFGTTGFFLNGNKYDASVVTWFLFMMVFMDTTATIPTGALAERWKMSSFFIFSLFIGGLIYPIYGCWVWGGGWLAQLGKYGHLGHGTLDYAGSSVVHLQGGAIALITSGLLGARIGKYGPNGKVNTIAGHHVPMVLLGTFILAFGWFGFNAGSSLAGTDGRIGIVAVNTMLASAGGALSGVLYMWWFGPSKKPDPAMACNSMLAGLVAITAPCAFVAPWAAFVIGVISGVLVIWSVFFFDKIRIDDPVGAISVHGVNGLFGLLCIGIFADGTYGDGLNGVAGGVTGFLYGDHSFGQFWAQCIAGSVCIGWNVVAAGIIFFVIGKVIGGNRPSAADEVAGLDMPEMGVMGYPEFTLVKDTVPGTVVTTGTTSVGTAY